MGCAHTKINSMIGMTPLVLFLSSYMPLFLLIAIRQIISNSNVVTWKGDYMHLVLILLKNYGMAIICISLALYGLWGTYVTFKHIGEKMENGNIVKITEISSMNDEPLAYVATYIIPIMFNDYSNIADNITILCIFYVVYKLYIHSKLILVNPMLSMKYSIFNIKYDDDTVSRQGILISKDKFIEENDRVKIYNVGYQLYYGYKR